jgi:hypothetical protein
VIAHLGALDFVEARENVVFLAHSAGRLHDELRRLGRFEPANDASSAPASSAALECSSAGVTVPMCAEGVTLSRPSWAQTRKRVGR